MKKLAMLGLAAALALSLSGCGERVEVPPAHLGKIMTKDGYREGTVATSKFRLDPCMAYCDKLVLLNVADQAYLEKMEIFMPEDKLKLKVSVRINLTLSPKKAESLFNSLPPSQDEGNEQLAIIPRADAYNTYASQIVQTETREYLSQYTIAEVASSLEKVNADLRARLSKSLSSHFDVRYVGITNIEYPAIITEAQENAARRREMIEQENAQKEVDKVKLEREFQEAQLQRKIDVEKAEADAQADRVRAEAITPAVMNLRKLEIDRIKAEKWDGKLPRVNGAGNELLIDLRETN
jgi:hypothetical protein